MLLNLTRSGLSVDSLFTTLHLLMVYFPCSAPAHYASITTTFDSRYPTYFPVPSFLDPLEITDLLVLLVVLRCLDCCMFSSVALSVEFWFLYCSEQVWAFLCFHKVAR
jgi:hypothetical protein